MAIPNVNTASIPTPNISNPSTPTAQLALPSAAAPGPIFTPSGFTFGNIMDAVNLAKAQGGIVQLLPDFYDISSAGQGIPFAAGVVIQGSGFTYPVSGSGAGAAPANPIAIGSLGTVIGGNGTFPLLTDGKSDRGSAYGTATLMTAAYLFGTGAKNLQLYNGSYGIKCGGLFEGSVAWSVFEHISTVGCGWGVWFENADSCTFRDICNNNYSLGGHWHMSSGTTLINLGDSLLDRILYNAGVNTTYLSRNLVTGARQASSMNGMAFHNIGGVGGGTSLVSNTVSFPSSGSSIALTSGTTASYAVGLPISFSANTSGTPILNQQQIYFIQSIIDSTHFTLSDAAFASSAKTFSGAGTGTMITKGFAGWELVGYDTSNITGTTAINVGCESGGSMSYLVQGCNGSGGPCDIQLLNSLGQSCGVGGAQQNIQAVVARNNSTGLNLGLLQPPVSVDYDSSMQYISVNGYYSAQYQQGFTGVGTLAPPNSSFSAATFLAGFVGSGKQAAPYPLDIALNATSGVLTLGQRVPLVSGGRTLATGGSYTAGSGTLNLGSGNFIGVGGTPITIPAAADAYDGVSLWLYNYTGSPATIQLASGNFGGLTTTGSFSLAAGAAALVIGMVASGNNPIWVRFI